MEGCNGGWGTGVEIGNQGTVPELSDPVPLGQRCKTDIIIDKI